MEQSAHLLMGTFVGEMLERRLGLALAVSHFLVLLKVSRQFGVRERETLELILREVQQ